MADKAATAGSVPLAQLLVAHGASCFVREQNGDTPLHAAAHHSPDVLRVLLASDGDLRTRDLALWRSVLQAAAWRGSQSSLQLLLPHMPSERSAAREECVAEALDAALLVAAEGGHVDAARLLLSHGASVDASTTSCTGLGPHGGRNRPHSGPSLNSAVEVAADHGRVPMVEMLLDAGASPETPSALLAHARTVSATAKGEPLLGGASMAVGAGDEHLSDEWAAALERMKPLSRALLAQSRAPADVSAWSLLREVCNDAMLSRYHAAKASLVGGEEATVLRAKQVLDAATCASLRAALDADGTTATDSVDQLREHVLFLTAEELEALVGTDAMRRLLALTQSFEQACADKGHGSQVAIDATAPLFPFDCFLRRYSSGAESSGDQLLTSFHADTAAITVNVALTADADVVGGRLLGVYNGAVHEIDRAEGDVTVHSSALLHGVTRMHAGTRYSMILFISRASLQPASGELEGEGGA